MRNLRSSKRGKRVKIMGTRQDVAESRSKRRLLVSLSPCLLVSLSLGCAQTTPHGAAVDPLTGGGPLTGAVAPPTPVAPAAGVPPVPVTGTTPSTAALAAGAPTKPLPGGHDLRIGEQGATLRQPVPIVPVSGQNPLPATAVPPRVATYEQAQAVLQSRRVRWQKLEMVGDTGEWKFSCLLPSLRNPSSLKTYEAQAQTSLAAMQAVIDKLDVEN